MRDVFPLVQLVVVELKERERGKVREGREIRRKGSYLSNIYTQMQLREPHNNWDQKTNIEREKECDCGCADKCVIIPRSLQV